MNYTNKATVNEEYEFEVTRDELSGLDAISTSKNSYHILDNNTSHTAQVVASDFTRKTYQIQVNNNTYDVVIADAVDMLIKDMGFTVGGSKKQDELISPMPGLIIEVPITTGQEVKEGDTLLILSAMKMENSFVAHRDGIIKAVHIAKDDAVDKGQLLVEFEEH